MFWLTAAALRRWRGCVPAVLLDCLRLLRSFSEIPAGLMIIQTRSPAQEQSLGFHGNILKYASVHLCVLIRSRVKPAAARFVGWLLFKVCPCEGRSGDGARLQSLRVFTQNAFPV